MIRETEDELGFDGGSDTAPQHDWESGEGHLGTAVIGLAFNCSLEEASPRIVRAMQLPDPGQRGFAFTAAGTAARLNVDVVRGCRRRCLAGPARPPLLSEYARMRPTPRQHEGLGSCQGKCWRTPGAALLDVGATVRSPA